MFNLKKEGKCYTRCNLEGHGISPPGHAAGRHPHRWSPGVIPFTETAGRVVGAGGCGGAGALVFKGNRTSGREGEKVLETGGGTA